MAVRGVLPHDDHHPDHRAHHQHAERAHKDEPRRDAEAKEGHGQHRSQNNKPAAKQRRPGHLPTGHSHPRTSLRLSRSGRTRHPSRGHVTAAGPFIDKVRDIVGLYLNPPEAAVVMCVDEKSQIQALDRSAPVLPLMPGVPARQTHDYVRNGITNLYAALDVASGRVLTETTARHRAEEFRRFLNLIDASVPAGLDVHVVLDNSATHKTPSIQRWLVRHPRFTFHFTPT